MIYRFTRLYTEVNTTNFKLTGVKTTYFWDAVSICNDSDNVIEGQEGMTVDLREHILALRAVGKESHQLNVVVQGTAHFRHVVTHQLNKSVERCCVVVEQQHILTGVDQLCQEQFIYPNDNVIIYTDCANILNCKTKTINKQ